MHMRFRVIEENTTPIMYGIGSTDGLWARHISTDYVEVAALAARCNRAGLSTIHLMDLVEDFRRS